MPGPGEAGREPAGKVPGSDTPPLELFSRSHVILPEEQILSTIYGKSAILHNYDGLRGRARTQPGIRCGRPEFDS